MKNTFNVWDFGGQISQASIHNMFLSKNCVFAIVIEPRMNDCERDFLRWYKNIRQYIIKKDYKLPLLVVFSKCDNENGGVGNSLDFNCIIEKIKNKIIDEIKFFEKTNQRYSYQYTNELPFEIKFIKSSSMTKFGIKDLLENLDKIFDIANGLKRMQVNQLQKKLLNGLINQQVKDKNSFYFDHDLVRKIASDISAEYEDRTKLSEDLIKLAEFGDIFYTEKLEGLFLNPTRLSSIVYQIICSNTENQFENRNINTSFGYFLNSERKNSSKVYAEDIDKFYHFEKKEISRALLELLRIKGYLFKRAHTYYIPSRLRPMMLNFPEEKLKKETGVRHFIFKFKPSVVGLSWKIVSYLISSDSNYKFEDNEIFSNGFCLTKEAETGEIEMAVIRENERINGIDVWITKWYDLNGLWHELYSEIPKSLGSSDSTLLYDIYCVCPCKGRWYNECEHIHRYSKIYENRKKSNTFICTESNKTIYYDNLLINSEDITSINNENDNDGKRKIFVITPFNKNNNDKFLDNIKSRILNAYNHCGMEGLFEKPTICDEECSNTTIDEQYKRMIKESELIIAILDDDKPNVYFEFGLSMAYDNKYYITFIDKNSKGIPFDVQHIRNLKIDYNNLDEFEENLIKKFSDYINKLNTK